MKAINANDPKVRKKNSGIGHNRVCLRFFCIFAALQAVPHASIIQTTYQYTEQIRQGFVRVLDYLIPSSSLLSGVQTVTWTVLLPSILTTRTLITN
jgi:hypothetical protein